MFKKKFAQHYKKFIIFGLVGVTGNRLWNDISRISGFENKQSMITQIEEWSEKELLIQSESVRKRRHVCTFEEAPLMKFGSVSPYEIKIKKRQCIVNILKLNSYGRFTACYNEVMGMKDYIDKSQDQIDSFVVLPYLYLKEKYNEEHNEEKLEGILEYSRIAAHYNIFTRDICYSYLLSNGHFITYSNLLLQDVLYALIDAIYALPYLYSRYK